MSAAEMNTWQPIDTYPMDLWEPLIVHLKDEDGNEAVGSWGWDDEGYDSVYGAWHKQDDVNEPLGFEPTHWKPV